MGIVSKSLAKIFFLFCTSFCELSAALFFLANNFNFHFVLRSLHTMFLIFLVQVGTFIVPLAVDT